MPTTALATRQQPSPRAPARPSCGSRAAARGKHSPPPSGSSAGTCCCFDADLRGDVRGLCAEPARGLRVARFARQEGGGVGLAKGAARALIGLRARIEVTEPLSGQRALDAQARAAVFPLATGFGAETRMTIDAVRAGLDVEEIELDLEHRATGRDLRGFVHRGRQLVDLLLACGPQRVNYRGLRLPLVGWPSAAVPTGARRGGDRARRRPLERARARLPRAPARRARRPATLKLVGDPAVRARCGRASLSAALLVGLAANAVNQLDTRPGRALKALARLLRSSAGRRVRRSAAVLLAPYDLREMAMLGDAGVERARRRARFLFRGVAHGRRSWCAIGALAGLTLIGERRSLGALIERTPVLRALDGSEARVTEHQTKYVFVTGGVVSSLGKGIIAASLGRLLKSRGLKVQAQKFDPYLNVDPGTMSPFQHGEVFVTEDGAETDLDLGHYERFIDENLSRNSSHSAGAIWETRAPQGAQGRLPRRDGAGDPAHHERDQGAHPARRRGDRRRRRHLRDRRHRRRHRVAAVPRGDPPVPARGRAGERPLPPRHARAVHRGRGRAEDEADAALGQRAAPHRYPPGHRRLPLARRAVRRHPREDRAVRRRRRRGGDRLARRARRLPGSRSSCSARASTSSSASGSASTRRLPCSASGRISPI